MSLPVNLEKIASELGIILLPYPLPSNISGLAFVGRKKFILYNSNHPLTRQRFTIAHEIWHIKEHLLREGKMLIFDAKSLEREADRKAAEILLPWDDLYLYIKEAHWRYNLTELARRALVSPITLVRRLNETGLLKVSLHSLRLDGRGLSMRRLIGEPTPLPSYSALIEGAQGKEFFIRKDGFLFRFSRYGRERLLYVYP